MGDRYASKGIVADDEDSAVRRTVAPPADEGLDY
jgi:hypothetical protein